MSDRPLTETITVTREVPRNIRDLVLFHQEMRKVEATLVRDLTPDELVRLARHFDGRPCPTRVGPPAAAATCPHSRLTPGCAPCWEAYATALVKLIDDPVSTVLGAVLHLKPGDVFDGMTLVKKDVSNGHFGWWFDAPRGNPGGFMSLNNMFAIYRRLALNGGK